MESAVESGRLGRPLSIKLGSFILLLQALGFAGSAVLAIRYGSPQVVMIVFAAIGGAIALGMALIALGIFRLRSWARVVVLLMALFGLFSALMIPFFPSFSARGAHRFSSVAIWVMELPWIAVSLWWLYVLNKPAVKQGFQGSWDRTGRPLSIMVIALLFVATPLSTLAGVLTSLTAGGFASSPYFSQIMGVAVPTPLVLGFDVVVSVAGVVLGIGLWRLRAWARQAAMWYLVVMFVHALLSAPGLASMPPPDAQINQAQWNATLQAMPFYVIVSSTLATLLPLWFLITRRKSFSS